MVALAWMILKFANTSAAALFTKGMHVEMVADRVDGVSDGSPVLYLGVNVGRVMGVKRQPNNQEVRIRAMLDPGDPLPENLVGVIRQQSALGASAAISLELTGPASATHLAENAVLHARFAGGGVVPQEFTVLATEIRQQQLIKHVDETVVTLRAQLEKAGQFVDSAREFVGDPKLRQDVQSAAANIRTTSENLQQFSARLDGFGKKLDDLSTEMSATVKDAHEAVKQARTTIADGGRNMEKLSLQFDRRLDQVANVLASFESISAKIDKGQGTAGALVNDPRLYESLVDTSRELSLTASDLKRLVEQWEQEGFSLKLK
jgi:phospholipid/cholesterol/gamma-HCH transport system substrate-binding protein